MDRALYYAHAHWARMQRRRPRYLDAPPGWYRYEPKPAGAIPRPLPDALALAQAERRERFANAVADRNFYAREADRMNARPEPRTRLEAIGLEMDRKTAARASDSIRERFRRILQPIAVRSCLPSLCLVVALGKAA